MYSGLRYFSYGIALGLPVAVTFADYVGIVAVVAGNSMRPTLNPAGSSARDVVWVSRRSLRHSQPHPGDIIALSSPTHPSTIIKRVVAVEGQLVHPRSCDVGCVVVPAGHCWVEGDNSKTSRDSNMFGVVSQGLILGRATHVVWPPQRWGRLDHQLLPSQSQRKEK